EAGLLALLAGRHALLDEHLHALELAAGEVAGLLGLSERGAGLLDAGARRGDLGFGLGAGARVEQWRGPGHDRRDGLAGLDPRTRAQLDALELAADRRRDDVAVGHARHAVLVDRHLHRAACG